VCKTPIRQTPTEVPSRNPAELVCGDWIRFRRKLVADLALYLGHDVWVLLEVGCSIVASLGKPCAAVGIPRPALLDDVELHGQVYDLAERLDTLAENDVKLRHPIGRCHLVLDNLYLYLVANDRVALGDTLDATHFQPHG